MTEITGIATSYDLPNYLGVLFQKSDKPNSFLRALNGLVLEAGQMPSARPTGQPKFAMGVNYALPAPAQPAVLEGASPTASETDTAQEDNIVQIFHEAVELTYSRLAATQAISGIASAPGGGDGALLNPGTFPFQLRLKYQKIAQDINFSTLRGSYASPANNVTARKTRGVRTAITTHDTDGAAGALTKAMVEGHLQGMVEGGALAMGADIWVFGAATPINKLAALYKGSGDVQPPVSRTVVGLQVRTIYTDWAVMNLVWEPDVAALELVTIQPQFCQLVHMPIPGKGTLFPEPLDKDGSAEKMQIYGELGIDYRSEFYHGVIRDFT